VGASPCQRIQFRLTTTIGAIACLPGVVVANGHEAPRLTKSTIQYGEKIGVKHERSRYGVRSALYSVRPPWKGAYMDLFLHLHGNRNDCCSDSHHTQHSLHNADHLFCSPASADLDSMLPRAKPNNRLGIRDYWGSLVAFSHYFCF